jgi:CRP/FNR family transcriptional regulator
MRACNQWEGVSDDALRATIRLAQVLEVSKGALLAAEGEPVTKILVVARGHLRVVDASPQGHGLTLADFRPSDAIGTITVLSGWKYPGNLEAAEDSVLASISAAEYRQLVQDQPAAFTGFLNYLVKSFSESLELAKQLTHPVPARIADFLIRQPRRVLGPNSFTVRLPGTRVELASTLGTVPETLSRAFRGLQDDGILKGSGQTITVLDAEALYSLAREGDLGTKVPATNGSRKGAS